MNKRLLCATALLFAQQATALPFFGNTDPFATAITNNSYEDFIKAKIAQPDALNETTYRKELLQQSKDIEASLETFLNSGQESKLMGLKLGLLTKAASYLSLSYLLSKGWGVYPSSWMEVYRPSNSPIVYMPADLVTRLRNIFYAIMGRDYVVLVSEGALITIPIILGIKGLTNLKQSYQSIEDKIKNQELIQKELGA